MAASTTQVRRDAARRFVVLQKTLSLRLRAQIPAEIREDLSQVTHHQMEALAVIAAGPLTMGELAGRMGSSSMSAMTQLADRMVRMGLVEREADPNDRRVVRLALTDAARNAVVLYMAAHEKAVAEVFGTLDDESVVTLLEILERMARAASVDPAD